MTDYGASTTPALAIEQEANQLKSREQRYRRDAAILLAKADETRDICENLQDAVDRYNKWQPDTKADVVTCTVPTLTFHSPAAGTTHPSTKPCASTTNTTR